MLPNVIYLDDILNAFINDDIGLPPVKEDDDHRPEPQCAYDGPSMFEDEDFGDLYHDPDTSICTEKPEYYIRTHSHDPLDDRVYTYYYCPRHFALNIGYLCDVTSRRGPKTEIRNFVEQGDIPDCVRIQSWGPMTQLAPNDGEITK